MPPTPLSALRRRGASYVEVVILVVVALLLAVILLPTLLMPERSRKAAEAKKRRVAERRGEMNQQQVLEHEAGRIEEALRRGRRFSQEHDTIVEAHFTPGTNNWRVRSVVSDEQAAATSPTLDVRSPVRRSYEDWQFRSFLSPTGEAASPTFVFFPDGFAQGGEVEFGWDTLQCWLRVDEKGRMTFHIEDVALEAPDEEEALAPEEIDDPSAPPAEISPAPTPGPTPEPETDDAPTTPTQPSVPEDPMRMPTTTTEKVMV